MTKKYIWQNWSNKLLCHILLPIILLKTKFVDFTNVETDYVLSPNNHNKLPEEEKKKKGNIIMGVFLIF